MTNDLVTRAKEIFNIPKNHALEFDSERSSSGARKGVDRDDDYFIEKGPDGNIIATYHTFHSMNIYPPHQVYEQGWVKYDAENKRVDSGRKYPF